MALQEYYNTGRDSSHGCYAAFEIAQTFTPQVSYDINSVKLYVKRLGTITNVIVGIYATEGGHPTGEALCSATIDGSGWSDSSFAWIEWEFAEPASLDINTKYAIWVDGTGYDTSNCPMWGYDGSSPGYTNGNMEYDSGSGWVTYDAADLLFETYGTAPAIYVDLVGTGGGTGGGSAVLGKTIMDNMIATGGGVGGGSAALVVSGFPSEGAGVSRAYRRVVAAGNDQIFYEDI